MNIEAILSQLDKVRRNGSGYMACCPAHDDKSPSLSLGETNDGRILLHCFAGCSAGDILGAIGMSLSDIMPNAPYGEFKPHWLAQKDKKDRLGQDRKIEHEKMILAITEVDRKAGKIITRDDLAREKQAFIMVRNYEMV